ncbi:uncharacterized protein LOC131326825 [Rhododendron vialii]|uniref:uncharacterized protein LOC131326825 n=1 Tax=Rhododendron vialii TaxID=182163 RepID=UPI00265E8C2B|nr:uncharacterized protein LOC131326825 [Rhododendron vialii]
MASLALPRFAVFQLKSRHTYLRYIPDDGELHGTLQFTGEEMGSPCYNNKYWMAKSSSDTCIVAGADEPNEDQSQWSRTLFKPIRIDGEERSTGSTISTVHAQFRHVQLGFYLDFTNEVGLYADSTPDRHWSFIFHIHDWETLLILPKHIELKGDNGLYLSARLIHGRQYLQFASSDNGDPTVGNEVFISQYGNVRIKNNHSGKFWRLSPNWIWADSDDTTTDDSDTLFSPVKVGDNVIALRCMVNKSFCMRISEEGKENCLNAGVQTLCREARLVVEELVISREIYNVYFRRLAARI